MGVPPDHEAVSVTLCPCATELELAESCAINTEAIVVVVEVVVLVVVEVDVVDVGLTVTSAGDVSKDWGVGTDESTTYAQ